MKIFVDKEAKELLNAVCDHALKGSGLEILDTIMKIGEVTTVANNMDVVLDPPAEKDISKDKKGDKK